VDDGTGIGIIRGGQYIVVNGVKRGTPNSLRLK
jgi:hypothetical protein